VDNGVVDTGEGMDDEFYDDYEDAGMDTDIDETPSRPSRRTAAGADRRDVAPKAALDFVPGYHGVIDFGYTFGLGDSIHAFSRMELTITQGYQFTPSLFAGLGTGVHLYSDSVQLRKIVDNVAIDNSYLSYVFPIFVDVRYNFSGGQIRPFAALKVGYGIGLSKTTTVSVTEGGSSSRKTEYKAESLGFYIAPSVGAKFMIGRSIAFSLGVGYSMQMYGSETFKSGDPTIKIKSTDIMGGLTIKAGLEF
jgi:hypothetical protein